MRKTPARITCALVVGGLLAATVPELEAQQPPSQVHGVMRADAATRLRWQLQRKAALPAARETGAAISGTATLTPPPTHLSLLSWVPDSASPDNWDQGGCGSCWVWASTAMSEVALKKTFGIVDYLSIQYFQSNHTDKWACNGGNLTDFCNWYNTNSNPGVMVPRSNPQAGYADGNPEATYQLASVVGPDGVGMTPRYAGLTLTNSTVATTGVTQAAAIANIQAALMNYQAVGFSFETNFDNSSNGFYTFWGSDPDATLWVNAYEGGTWDSGWGGHMVTLVGWNEPNGTIDAASYWILLNQWGTTSGRSDGCFRMPMLMNYGATYSDGGYSGYDCYGFETMTLSGTLPASAVPTGTLAVPSSPVLAGQQLTLAPVITGGTPPFTYQWKVGAPGSQTAVSGATGETLSLPNGATPGYGVLDSSWNGRQFSLTITNGAGSTTLGPVTLAVAGSILNPDSGFELGSASSDWTVSDTVAVNPVITSSSYDYYAGPMSGNYFAQLTGMGHGSGNAGTFTSSLVTLPPTSVPVYATYYLCLGETTEVNPLVLSSCTLQVVDASGAVLKVLKTHTNMDVDHLTYLPESFDISALNTGGNQVAIQAKWSDPDAKNLFLLDNVQIVSGVASSGNASLTGFSPAAGAPGATVTLTGSHFTGARAVVFGRSNAQSFSVVSDTELTAVVPWDGATGPITVTAPAGTISSASPFYVAPSFISNPSSYGYALNGSLAEVSPVTGPPGTVVQLSGLNFTGATGVSFGGVAASAFTVENNTGMSVTVPVNGETGHIVVTTPGGTATSAGTYTVAPPPTLSSVSPTSGYVASPVTLTGTNLTTAQTVQFGTGSMAPVTSATATTVTSLVPSGAKTGAVTILTDGGTAAGPGTFTVLAPTLSSVPGGTPEVVVALVGNGFLDATAVTFNGVASPSIHVTDNTHLSASIPELASSGTYPVQVVSPEGSSNVISAMVTVPAPVVSSFAPASGPVASTITVTGLYLTGTTQVTIGGVPATFTLAADTLIVTVPATAVTGPIVVTTGEGTGASSTPFTVQVQVTIPQAPDDLLVGTPFSFTATVTGTPTTSVTWSVQEGMTGGSVTGSGVYTAPATAGVYHVLATSTVMPSSFASVAVPVNSACLNPADSAGSAVTVVDLAYLISAYGSSTGAANYNARADYNGDGSIGDADLALLLSQF